MPLFMIRNDITKVSADAIVNPANGALLEGSGTSRATYLAAGEEKLAAACKKIGHCDLGKAVATKAFGLHAKYIIHAVGPVWGGGGYGEEEYLYRAYWESMLLAKKYHLESIAFPLLSSGNYGYPKDLALKVAIRAISDFLMEEELLVYLVVYDRSAVTVSKKLFAAVEEYIDDHYVEQKGEQIPAEEDHSRFAGRGFWKRFPLKGNTSSIPPLPSAVFQRRKAPEELRPGMREPEETEIELRTGMREPEERVQELRSGMYAPKEPEEGLWSGMYAPEKMMAAPAMSQRSLDDLLHQMEETFSQMLLRLIDERGLKDSYVYKKANVDRRHFSKIRNDRAYAPNKKTVLAFAVALELSLDETKDLLMRAGFAFSRCSKFDVIVCYFIENRKYDIFEINEMLFAYEQPLLGE